MKTQSAYADAVLSDISATELLRICRDLAWSEMAVMPGVKSRLGPRLSAAKSSESLNWSPDGLALDSLARMQLATAASIWCNALDSGFEDLFLAKRNAADWADVMQRARSAGACGFTFSTSGSTGKRRHIRHAEDTLTAEAQVWAQLLQAGVIPVKRVVLLVPCHHMYGFIWGVLLPRMLGVSVFDASHDALPELAAGDLVVAVPDQWQWLATSRQRRLQAAPAGPVQVWPEGVQGVSSTAPMPAPLHHQLVTSNAAEPALLTRLLQIYGSTETGGVGWRDCPDQPYALAQGRIRSASDGIELQLPSGMHAQLALQDELQWTSSSDFHLLRRTDCAVQVGGHNVSAVWVVEQLLAHPAVQDASVRLDTAAPLPRLKAFVVLKVPSDLTQQDSLEAWITHNLPWYANFSSISYGTQIPCNSLGKHSDWPVQDRRLL